MRGRAAALLGATALIAAACAGPPTAEQCANRLEITLTYPVIDQSRGAVGVVRGDEARLELISVATAERAIESVIGLEASDVSLSPDGTVFVMSGEDGGLTAVEVATGEQTPLGIAGTRPTWSPDGTRIAYIGLDTALWVAEADGSNPVSLGSGRSGSPAWSPDGTQLAFSFDVEIGALGYEAIQVMDVTGNGNERVARGVTLDRPAWSPDGTRLAFHDFDGVNVMCADGSLAYEIVPDALFPVWAPNGNQIVFTSTSNERGGPGLFIIEAGGGVPIRLTDDATDMPRSWSADPWP